MFAYDTILAYVLLERRDRAYELDTAARIQQALFLLRYLAKPAARPLRTMRPLLA